MSIRDREQAAAASHARGGDPDPANVIRFMRKQALTITPAEAGLDPAGQGARVWGVLMEFGDPEAVLTLAAFAEGTTSIYISTGGAIIGAGDHDEVRMEAEELLRIAEQHQGMCAPAALTPLPLVGRVRFYLRTFSGSLGADASVAELEDGTHPLTPVYLAGHRVIAAVDGAKHRHDRGAPGLLN